MNRLFVSIILVTMVVVGPLTAQAAPPDVWVDIGNIGTVLNNQANPDTDPNCVVLAPATGTAVTYGNANIGTITIQRKTAGAAARVCRISDEFVDHIILVNAIITRTAPPVTNFPITAWALHTVGPTATPATPYYYNVEMSGTFWGPNGTQLNGCKFTSTGKIQPNANGGGQWDINTGTTTYTVSGCPPNACTKTFANNIQFGPFDTLLDQPRGLKNEMQLTLRANTQTLTFDSAGGYAQLRSGVHASCDPRSGLPCP